MIKKGFFLFLKISFYIGRIRIRGKHSGSDRIRNPVFPLLFSSLFLSFPSRFPLFLFSLLRWFLPFLPHFLKTSKISWSHPTPPLSWGSTEKSIPSFCLSKYFSHAEIKVNNFTDLEKVQKENLILLLQWNRSLLNED